MSFATLINDQCALARRPAECGPGGNGAACVTCFQSRCQAQSAQCVAAPSGGAGSGLER
jgi:hypothetical protein